jgi:hypothetical protein
MIKVRQPNFNNFYYWEECLILINLDLIKPFFFLKRSEGSDKSLTFLATYFIKAKRMKKRCFI